MKFVYSATTVSMKTKSTAAASAAVAPTEDESDDNTVPLPYDPETLDPLDPRRVSLDIFEVYCHEMVTTGEVRRRAFLIKKMRYMIHRLIGNQYEYGRLFNYTTVANLVGRMCGRHAYYGEEDEDDECQLLSRLVDFDLAKWKTVIDQLGRLRDSLIRKDATLIVLPTEIEDTPGADKEEVDEIPEEDEEIDTEKESSEAFTTSFLQMKDWLKFHACLSCIQPQLQNALNDGTDVIPKENIAQFHQAIHSHFDGGEENEYADILDSLFSNSGTAGKKRAKKDLSLKSLRQLKTIHSENKRVFDLENLQLQLLKLVRRWVKMVLPVPNLARLGYGSVDAPEKANDAKLNDAPEDAQSLSASSHGASAKKSARKRRKTDRTEVDKFFDDDDDDEDDGMSEAQSKVKKLKQTRQALSRKVKDPLEESVARAAALPARQEKASPKKAGEVMGKLLEKKASAVHLEFADSEEELSEAEGGDLKISQVPERLKRAEDSKPAPINIQLPGQQSGPAKRKRFTEEEDQAILTGVERFGAGKWTEIKSTFPTELRDRNTVQIKDRYRTLTKSAE